MMDRYWSWVSRLSFWVSNVFVDLVNKETRTEVGMVVHDDRVAIIVPSGSPAALEHHLIGVTSENVHEEVDFGGPVGREAG